MLPGRDRIVGEHFRGDRLLHGASIYILRCSDGSDYTGVTRRSVDERVSEHAQGIDEDCYTFRRRPVKLVHAEHYSRPPMRRRPSVASRGGLERRRKPISAAIMPYSLHSQNGAENARWGRDDLLWIRPSRPLRGASATVLAVKRFLGAMAVCLAGWR